MKSLLILNGSHSEIPLIEAARELGYRVITTGAAPDLPGHPVADEFHLADYSDEHAMLELASRLGIDAICACANDFAAISAAYVAEKMDLPGHDDYATAKRIHQKDSFKQLAGELGISIPDFRYYDDLQAAIANSADLPLPVIVKPVDMSGGKGISIVGQAAEYDAAVRLAFETSRQQRIVVERFVEGSLHSFSSFIVGGKVRFSYSDNEYCGTWPFWVASSGGPATDIGLLGPQLKNQVEIIADRLQLVDGIFHIQYLYDGAKAFIIDVTRRCSGDLYPVPVSRSIGFDWAQWIVRAEAGESVTAFPEDVMQSGFRGRHCVAATRRARVSRIDYSPEIESNIEERFEYLPPNPDTVVDENDKLAVVSLKFASRAEMDDRLRHINDHISVIYH